MTDRQLGRIKWFDNKKGFGFLTRLEDNTDIFLHFSSITAEDNIYKTLIEGEYVEFSLKTDQNNKLIAVDITGVSRGPLLCQNTERRIYSVKRSQRGQPRSGDRRRSDKNSSE